MRAIWAIARRELYSFYVNPIAYIALPIFFLIITAYFIDDLARYQDTNEVLRQMFYLIFFVSLFMLPMISMRAFSEEYQEGTFELLFTVPVTTLKIVLGKYLGLLMILISYMAMALVYIIVSLVIATEGNPALGRLGAQFLGVILAGASFLSIGVFVSSLTRYQIATVIVTMLISLILIFLQQFVPVDSGPTRMILERLSFFSHYSTFLEGAIKLEDLFYFFAIPAFFLTLTHIRLDLRKT